MSDSGSRYPALVIATLMLVYTCGYVDRYALTIVLEQVKASLSVSDAYMGFLAGPAFALLFTLASLPIARLADRYSRVLILALGCATWSGFTLLSAFATTPAAFTLARLGVGLGEATCLAPAYSLIADYFPPRRRALPVGFFNLSVYLGQIIGLWFGGSYAARLGWRETYLLIGAPGLAIALAFWLVVREPVRGALEGASGGPRRSASIRATARALFRIPSFPGMVAGAALATFSGMSFAYWAPTFFMRAHHLPQAEIGRSYGLIFGFSSMLGALAAGRLGNALAARSGGGPLLLAAAAVAGVTCSIVAVCLAPNTTLALALLVPFGLVNGAWLVPVQATLQDFVAPGDRATSAAIFVCLALLVGFTGPWLVGFLSDRWAPILGGQALRLAIIATSSAGLAGVAALVHAARRGDRSRLVAVGTAALSP